MIYSIEGSGEIEENKKNTISIVNNLQDVIVDTEQCSFCAVPTSIGRLKWIKEVLILHVRQAAITFSMTFET